VHCDNIVKPAQNPLDNLTGPDYVSMLFLSGTNSCYFRTTQTAVRISVNLKNEWSRRSPETNSTDINVLPKAAVLFPQAERRSWSSGRYVIFMLDQSSHVIGTGRPSRLNRAAP
jgi:hypothetical protein